MLSLVRSSTEQAMIEESIINSDTYFNLVSKNKEKLSSEEIEEEIKNAINIGAERFLIKSNNNYIGILEYLLTNPNDLSTWLGLLLIKKDFQSQGYGMKALELFNELMRKKGIGKYRIGVIAENKPAHNFWIKHGFFRIDSTINNDNKEIIIYEKNILEA